MFSPGNKTDRRPLLGRMYWRIWLAMVLTMLALVAAMTLIWRIDVEHDRAGRPGHEIVVRDVFGEEIGYARATNRAGMGPPSEFQVVTDEGQVLWVELPRPRLITGPWDWLPWATLGWAGVVAALGFLFMLLAFPVVRGLTRRLERLEAGVQQWGDGNLAVRLPEDGRDEVAELARRFNKAAEQVQVLVAAHKQLLANASHELRSPLARIRMGLALLGQDSPNDHQVVREIEVNIRELDQLIDEVLLASRLEHGQQAVDLSEDIDLVALVVEEAAHFGIPVEVDQTVHVKGNAKLMQRLIRNLLENARRYGVNAQGVVDAQVSLRSRSPEDWSLVVADQGPGIPVEWRERIFEPFVRPPGATERQGSVGLGLSLVRTIARHHGLSVWCEERVGGGAQFVLAPKGLFSH